MTQINDVTRLQIVDGVAIVEFEDRKSTRLNSSHRCISYAVFCLKKKKKKKNMIHTKKIRVITLSSPLASVSSCAGVMTTTNSWSACLQTHSIVVHASTMLMSRSA